MKEQNYIRICLYCKVEFIIPFILIINCLLFLNNAQAEQIAIATQNAYNFYNAQKDGKSEKVLSRKNYQLRLNRMSKHIAGTLNKPDIVALQEVENFSTLSDLKNKLIKEYKICYKAILLDGHKKVAINVAYLVDCQFEIKNLSQLFKTKKLKNSNNTLFTRPPLYVNLCKNDQCIHLVNIHLRSMIGLNKIRKRHYVAKKRLQQAETLASWIDQFQKQWPEEKLMILGDFNALKVSDRYVDVLGIIKGTPANFNEKYSSTDLIHKNLFDLSLQIPMKDRYSYRYRKKQQILDYMLVSQNIVPATESIKYTQIDYKVSDHAGLVAVFDFN